MAAEVAGEPVRENRGFPDVAYLTKDTTWHPTVDDGDLDEQEGICLGCGCKVTKSPASARTYGHAPDCERERFRTPTGGASR